VGFASLSPPYEATSEGADISDEAAGYAGACHRAGHFGPDPLG
jgi:hypothetical protein